jgi:hypothetical protein
MVRAYDHMQPFPRLNSFVSVRIHELKESLSDMESEARMWAEPMVQEVVSQIFESDENGTRLGLRARQAELASCTYQIQREIAQWKRLMDQIESNACIHCAGRGETTVYYDQDSSSTNKCKPCDGTGTRLKVTPVIDPDEVPGAPGGPYNRHPKYPPGGAQ